MLETPNYSRLGFNEMTNQLSIITEKTEEEESPHSGNNFSRRASKLSIDVFSREVSQSSGEVSSGGVSQQLGEVSQRLGEVSSRGIPQGSDEDLFPGVGQVIHKAGWSSKQLGEVSSRGISQGSDEGLFPGVGQVIHKAVWPSRFIERPEVFWPSGSRYMENMDPSPRTTKAFGPSKSIKMGLSPPDQDSDFKPCQWYIILILGAVVLLFIVQLSTPIIPFLSLIDFSVTDGKINGTLSLGTYGYCLYLPNKACSHAHFLYDIGQFFFQPLHFITSSYLL